jgi:hypothetical protein
MTFNEFHASVTKQMPDAVKYPEMYDLCYRLMKLTWDAAKEAGWEDRSAIQGTNPGLAELIKANQEIVRLRKYVVRQHDYFTGKDVPDLIVTTGTDYEDVQIQEEKPSND